MSAVLYSSQRLDWATPHALFAGLHREFAFTLDVCASPENACLPRFLTEADEGLMHSWAGERVWCNPPYGRQVARWAEKVWNEANVADVIVALVPSRTDTRWWHEYAMQADEIRFLRRRLRFDDSGQAAPFPSALVIFRLDKHPPPVATSHALQPELEPKRNSLEGTAVHGPMPLAREPSS